MPPTWWCPRRSTAALVVARVNVTKAKLEGLFADELALLQPSPGYMRLLKESVLQIWKARKAAVSEEIASAERQPRRYRTS